MTGATLAGLLAAAAGLVALMRGRSTSPSTSTSASTGASSGASTPPAPAPAPSGRAGVDLDEWEATADVELTPQELVRAYPGAADVALDLLDLADELGASPRALANLIQFESGWRPNAVNATSGASGLIQFMPKTAAGLGSSVEAIRTMSAAEQWPLVRRYLLPYRGKVADPLDLFLAVFYPAAMGKGPGYTFNNSVQRANPGIVTAGDYARLAMRRAKL